MNETKCNKSISVLMAQNRRGQSLILALLIMFMLVFIGGVFVVLISRNIVRAQRSREVLNADYLAETGIRYVDDQLTYSSDGADWRPVPTFPGGGTPSEDPDKIWLDNGFTRVSYGKGRFLIKVTYNPNSSDPMSKFIKIESVGREGEYDRTDPTTWNLNQPLRARKEKVAYKAIAITDYARFITNKDRRTDEVSLGTPRYVTTFGESTGAATGYGGSIRVNGDLLWHGNDNIWLDSGRGDIVEVAGDIRHSIVPDDPATAGPDTTVVRVNNAIAKQSWETAGGVTDFNTAPYDLTNSIELGMYRDGRMDADRHGRPRQVFRIEAPLLDVQGPVGELSRYRELTRNSGIWDQNSTGEWYNSGFYGWGQGIYINNPDDVQTDSEAYTLRGNWTQPGGPYWTGPYYTPPGMAIALTPYDLDNADGDDDVTTGTDMILTHDSGPTDPKFNWYDANGDIMAAVGERVIMPYPQNGVIFAEGNIRIKGTLPPGVRLTVVSGATIYIDGNILKNPDEDPQTSAISLLATDYICVNTTQFFGPMKEALSAYSAAADEPCFGVTSNSSFWFSYASGVNVAQVGGNPSVYNDAPVNLYVRHTSDRDAGASYMNMLINYPPSTADLAGDPYYSVYKFDIQPWAGIIIPKQYIYPLADITAWTSDECAVQKLPLFEHKMFPLYDPTSPLAGYDYNPDPGRSNYIGFQVDTNSGQLPYLISRAAVQPCDVRIEALMYAQNQSFFVIPGEWFNPDPRDTEASWIATDPANPANRSRLACIALDSVAWPFYAQPLDVKITIYGAVSENIPAPIGDVRAWMDKWGWIPPAHGSSLVAIHDTTAYRDPLNPSDPTDTRQQGLTFVYDNSLLYNLTRMDAYNQILPATPKLPTSPGLLYFGEPT